MTKKIVPAILLILITLPTLLPFFNAKFFYTQDHIFIARLHQMSKALSDSQFPVRWAPDLRFGEPLFNFYAPLPYYLGALIYLSGINFIWVAKILFILSTVLSVFTMYVFANKLFGQKGAVLATVLYIYAPYRAVDLYVRGALSEAWAFIFFPLIFYGSVLIVEKLTFRRVSFLAFSLAGLILTHNVTTLIFLPFLILWWVYLLFKYKKWKAIFSLGASSILGIGLSAFFLLPALLERQFIQTKYLIVGYFDFRAHFVAYKQFFSTFWGYGSSLWGPKDDMSFQIGIAHWIILALALLIGIIFRKDRKLLFLLSFLGVSFIVSIFMQHNKSAFIWEAIPMMAFIQFPWRFLAISIFIISIIGAAITRYFTGRFKLIYFALIALVVVINFSYFKPRNYVEDSFFDKFLKVESMHQGVDLTKDYFPIWVKNDRVEYFGSPRAVRGEIKVLNFEKKTGYGQSVINVISDSAVELPITYFPGWEVTANGQVINLSEPSIQGLITFELPKGGYEVVTVLKDTAARTMGNFISLASLFIIFLGYVLANRSNNTRGQL